MSSLFGQVWLWSLLSFVAGVALTWLVLVRPAKRELEDLEERLLTSPRPDAAPGGPVVAPKAETADEFDNWHVEASRSLADDAPAPAPARYETAAERPRYEAAAEAPRYDVSTMKLDERDSLLEELDDEHRPLSDFEEQHDFPEFDEPPRSLFERPAPEGGQDTHETLEPKPRRPHPSEGAPDLPVEETTHLMPAVAEVAPRQEEPTAPPEVEFFQPREVWREEPVQEVYDEDVDTAGREEEDEPERRPAPAEETAFIPATALAQAIAEVDGEQRRADEPEPQVWPEHDLTGHFAPVDVESARGELAEPLVEHTPSDEAFFDELSRTRGRRQETQPEAGQDDARHEGPQTDVIRAVVDSRAPEPEPEVVEDRAEVTGSRGGAHAAEPEPPVAEPERTTTFAITPDAPAEPVEPPAFEPTFVQPESDSRPQHEQRHGQHSEPQPDQQQEQQHESTDEQRHEQPEAEVEPKPEPKPEVKAEPKPEPKKAEPARPRSLFEPLPDSELEPEPEQPRPTPPPSSGNDQPFVPTLAPELLAGNPVPMTPSGLPQRPTRPAGAQRTPPPAPLAPKPITPPPPRPVRPRPVGFSPSTGGRQPAPGSTRFQGQQEGFNPRSPFGPGSVLPKSDGHAPAPEFQVKATLTGRRYFTDESANFRETRADVWFRTTSDAEKAGFRPAP
ncbi:hypothetical protein [Saccharothrix sp. HUAS TT1]|uniref:sunset domain-containing protein n=1 Tax=unclassified Saccharothrix TaxID=2593673 RepID=UPI00345B4EA0